MKRLFILYILLFLTVQTNGQVIFDTTYIRQIGPTFFNVVRYEYENGNYNETQTLIGDSTTLYNNHKDKFAQRGSDMAIEVMATSGFAKKINEIFREADRVKKLTGKEPIDSLRLSNDVKSHYTANSWIVRGDVRQTIVFTYTSSGVLRYKIDSNSPQTARCIGKWVIRLIDYPTTNVNTDFFMINPNVYSTQDAKKIIRLNNVNRNRN